MSGSIFHGESMAPKMACLNPFLGELRLSRNNTMMEYEMSREPYRDKTFKLANFPGTKCNDL